MSINRYKSALFATSALGIGLLTFAVPALAQEEEIIVTARRVEERLQDVPISMTVFNQKTLTDRNVNFAEDLAKFTPSLSVSSHYAADNTSFALRGFNQEGKTSATVGLYFADVVAPRAGGGVVAAGDGGGPGFFFDLQDVQVLKGPQGTLFGRNTTGGAILLVPKKPTSDFGGYVMGSYGNYDMKGIQGVLNVPLGTKARLRVGFDRMTREGYENNRSGIGPTHLANVDYISGRASLVVDITPDLENYTVATLVNSDNNPGSAVITLVNPIPLPPGAVPGTINTGVPAANTALNAQAQRRRNGDFYDVEQPYTNPESWLQQWWLINTTTWHATDLLTVKNIMSYAVIRQNFRENIFGDYFPVTSAAGPGIYFEPSIYPPPGGHSNDQYNITEELQLQGRSANNKLNWQMGVYYEQSQPRSATTNRNPSRIECRDPILAICTGALGGSMSDSTTAQALRDMAAYAELNYAVLEKVKLTAGFRFTHDESKGYSIRKSLSFPGGSFGTSTGYNCVTGNGTLPNCFLHARKTSDAPTWRLMLTYNPTPDMMEYISYSRGYRQGMVNLSAPPGLDSFGPESVDVYEIGAKNTFRGRMPATVNFAVYYADFANQQIAISAFANPPVAGLTSGQGLYNLGQSHMWGLELEATVRPFPSFRVDASAGYLQTKVDRFSVPSSIGVFNVIQPTVFQGGPLIFSPKYKTSLTGTYTLPLPDSAGKVEFSANYVYQSAQGIALGQQTNSSGVLTGTPFGKGDPQNLVNLNLSWESIFDSPVDASFFVTNLLDDTYYTYSTGGYNSPGFGFDAMTIGSQPRFFGGRVKLRFGADAH